MKRRLSRTIVAALCGMALLAPVRALGEVRLQTVRSGPRNVTEYTDIVSDGPKPWKMRFLTTRIQPRLISVASDRVFFVHAATLRLIDTENGIVLGRWVFPDHRIDNVRAEGANFHVETSTGEGGGRQTRTTVISPDSPPPPYWIDSLLNHRVAVMEGSEFDEAAGLEGRVRRQPPGIDPRQPLPREAAERLIVEVEDSVRRDPFSPVRAVDLALLMKDAGRKEAESVLLRALDRPTNLFGELLWIASALEDDGEREWSTLAFDRGYALLWKQGIDPRLVSFILPRLITFYLPFELRLEMPMERRAKLLDRLYLIGPYVEGAPAAWKILSEYFTGQGDPERAALWRGRAEEAARGATYVWEPFFYIELLMRVLAALFLSLLLYYIVLQRRYAPQRRLLRRARVPKWWHTDFGLSVACWDRSDRRVLYFLVLCLWLGAGLAGAFGRPAVNFAAMPMGATSGTLRAPVTRVFLENLPAVPERDFLLALSLQQDDRASEAETLYRALPDSGKAWNNLGVLQASQGRNQEAAESFRTALRINPAVSEAAFNLGQPVTDVWAGMHRRYRPGQKMLALPSRDMVYRAVRGPLSRFATDVLRGPVSGMQAATLLESAYSYTNRQNLLRRNWIALGLFLSVVLPLLLAALFTPFREVTQPPGRRHWLLEILAPGTTRRWGRSGGIILGITTYAIVELASQRAPWTPFFGLSISRSFGFPPSIGPYSDKWYGAWPADIPWFWTSGLIALLVSIFTLNAVLVLRSRRTTIDRLDSGTVA